MEQWSIIFWLIRIELGQSSLIRDSGNETPFLFSCLFYAQKILSMLLLIQGIKISRTTPTISHGLYANDIMISCRANVQNAKAVHWCMEDYCSWSGQKVNFDKSSVCFSRNTNKGTKRVIKDVLSVKYLKLKTVYLGNHLIMGNKKTKFLAS